MNPEELAKKYGATYTPPTPANLTTLASKYGATYAPPKEAPIERGIIGSALNTLLVKPAARFAEAVGRTGVLGGTIKKGYEEMQGQNQEIKLPGAERAIGTVEAQRGFGEGGGTQIFSDALKSASYLAPYGRIAGGASTAARALGAGEKLARVAGGIGAGAAGGYGIDVSTDLDNNQKITAGAFVPGFATILGGVTGGALEGAGIGLEKLSAGAKAYAKELEEQTFKLTPTQRTNLGSKLDELTNFSLEKIPAGDPEKRLEYADDLIEKYEENLQSFLETVAKEKRLSTSIDKNTFIRQLRSIKGQYKYDRDAQAIYRQIDDVIDTINNQYSDTISYGSGKLKRTAQIIPVDKLNIFKRSTYQNAYNKAGNKVLDTVEHDIGDAARVAIERATKGGTIGDKAVGEFNHEYGNLIQIKKLLKVASGRPELGFFKRITSRIIGGLIGLSVGGGIPGAVGGELVAEPIVSRIAGTEAKTSVARKLNKVEPLKVGSVIQRLRPSSANASPTINSSMPITKATTKGAASTGALLGGALGTGVITAAATPSTTTYKAEPIVEELKVEVKPEKIGEALMQFESSGGKNTSSADHGEMKWLTGLTEVAIKELKRLKLIGEDFNKNLKKDVIDASIKYFKLMEKRNPGLTPGEVYVDHYWTQSASVAQRNKKIDEFNKMVGYTK